MITIIESGGANISSIHFGLERLGVTAQLSHDPEIIKKSSHIILPGVGAAITAMTRLKQEGLIELIRSLTQPVLGICLGMQLFFDFSEEGDVECLKLIPGKVKKLARTRGLSIPHMGWNTLQLTKNSPLMDKIANNSYAYYVHSYAAPVTEYTTAITGYGEDFSAMVQYKNFFGTQFHPEISSYVGMKILQNFLRL